MHRQVTDWLHARLREHPGHAGPGQRVLELGSRNINGTPRSCWPAGTWWLGIDAHAGRDVDVVGVAHEQIPLHIDAPVDVMVTTEMLEHDPFWQATLREAVRVLRPGGLLLLSCASTRRAPHHLDDSPVPGHYEGLDPDTIVAHLHSLGSWRSLHGEALRNGLDTFVVGVLA
jgi:SAM-dependent methyltransferase